MQRAVDGFNLRITPEMLNLVKEPADPIWRQYVPTPEENEVVDGIVDSLGEDADSPVPNITHRYPDRVLFLVSPVCAAYCRFCTRRRKVGDPEKIPLGQFDAAFAYIREHTEVRDVSLSGGDPLMLSDRRVEYFLQKLRAIPHVEIVRIHTRIPSQLPERITPALCETIKKYHPVFVNVHFNHPDELTPATRTALGMLADAGCPLGSQTVLLKGVNDDPADHEAADAGAAQVPGPALLPLPGRPRRGRRALPDLGREGPGDHRGAPGLDLGTGRPALRHRRARRRREDPAPARSTCSR